MFKMLRQPLFNAESDMGGGGNESASSSSDMFTPGWGLPNNGNQAADSRQGNPFFEAPATPSQQGQVFDFAGRKIEVSDPNVAAALKDVHKDYSALQGTFTQTSQRMKELEQANQTYLNLLNNMQQSAPANQTPQQAQPTEEDLEQMKSDFMEKFYDDPRSAIEGLLDSMFQQRVQPVIEPISQERQWNEQIADLQRKYPDEFPGLIGSMQELLTDMPELAQHGLEGIFHIARRAQPTPQQQPEQLLNDPQFIQRMMQNPDIQKQFLSQYVQEKQSSLPPTTIGGQPGGHMPVTPEQRPTDIKSATKAFKRYLGI